MSKFDVNELLAKLQEEYEPEYLVNNTGEPFIKIKTLNKTYKVSSRDFEMFILSFIGLSDTSSRKMELCKSLRSEVEAKCKISENKKPVYIRGAHLDNKTVIQLSNNLYCSIRDNKTELATSSDLFFWKPTKMLDMPQPSFENNFDIIKEIRNLVRTSNDNDYLLVIVFLLKALVQNNTSMPILVIQGEQGSGKTTLTKIIKKILDNSSPLIISAPKTERELHIIANTSFVLAFDNLSGISNEMSDAYSRLSTGAGSSCRKLYSDDDEISFEIVKPMIFNGIDDITSRPDFLERTVIIRLSKILNDVRVSESEINNQFDKNYPSFIGGLYTLLSKVLARLPEIRKNNLPRMTEYIRFGMALCKVLGYEEEYFIKCYNENAQMRNDDVFFDDPICISIDRLIDRNNYIYGSSSEIMSKIIEDLSLNRQDGFSRQNFHLKNPLSFSNYIRRIAPVLHSKGISCERKRDSTQRSLLLYKDRDAVDLNNLKTIKSINEAIGPL